MESKICLTCNKILPISLFHKEKTGYIRNKCTNCRNENTKAVRSKRQQAVKEIPTTKYCRICKLDKPSSEFNKLSLSSDGLEVKCRECYRIHRHKGKPISPSVSSMLICSSCNLTKSNTEFRSTNKSLTGYFKKCIACHPQKIWTAEKQKESEKKYIANNKEKLREKWRKAYTNPNRMIRDRLNHRIADALKASNTRKDNTTSSYIGCPIPYLRKWFEFQFSDAIGWHNYGEWHIDHVIPCAMFDLSNKDEQEKCFNWRNLRPCLMNENLSKGNKYITELIEQHNQTVSKFLELTPLPT